MPVLGPARFCSECKQRKLAEIEAQQIARVNGWRESLRRTAGVPSGQRGWTFDTWEGKGAAFRAAYLYAQQFPFDLPSLRQYPSLYIYGPVGVGKTHLACGIYNMLIDRADIRPDTPPVSPVRYVTAPGLLKRVRATYNRTEDEPGETEEDVFRAMVSPRLLIIDDISKESLVDPRTGRPPSEHTRRIYFEIIDARYGAGRPVVIVANISLQEFDEMFGSATASRISQMVRNKVIQVKGRDRRRVPGPGRPAEAEG